MAGHAGSDRHVPHLGDAAGSWGIEVGNFYWQFALNLLAWTGQLPGVKL